MTNKKGCTAVFANFVLVFLLNNNVVHCQAKMVCTYEVQATNRFCGLYGIVFHGRMTHEVGIAKCNAEPRCLALSWLNNDGGVWTDGRINHWYQACTVLNSAPNNDWDYIVKTCEDVTYSPTSPPTAAPTDWYAHPGHLNNFTEVQKSVTSLEEMIQTNNRTLTTLLTAIHQRLDNLELQTNDIAMETGQLADNLVVINTTIRAALRAVVTDVATINSTSAQLRAALVDTTKTLGADANDCDSQSCKLPSIESLNSDLTITANGGSAILKTDKCDSIDLCDVAQQSRNIWNALQNL